MSNLIHIDLAKAKSRDLRVPEPSRHLPPRGPRQRRRWIPPGRR